MRSKHLFITLDGVDGVGKTTVAKLLAADGAFQYYKLRDSLASHGNAV